MLDAALEYAGRGWPVFPVKPGDKMPAIGRADGGKGVLDATTDPARITDWWGRYPRANIGCHVGAAGMMVVDLDPGHDLDELHRVVEGLPSTHLRQTTPRGGEHLFYALAEGETVPPSGSKLCPHVDIRSDNSYVLLAPSITEAGTYTWAHETAWPPKPFPKPAYRSDGMIRACGEKRRRAADDVSRQWIIAPDMPENVEAAIKWLQSDACQPAIEGQGGNQRTYDTAAMMRSFGLSEGTAIDLLLQVYNSKCNPPWDSDEITVLVDNGYRYATSAPGNMTPAWRTALTQQLFKPQTRELPSGTERSAGKFRIVDRAGIEHIADPEWLVPDLLPRGAYGLLVGAPGTFKTFIALDLALSIACGSGEGRTWNKVVEAGPVLFALGEGRAGIKPRIAAWEQRHNAGKRVADFYLADPVPLVSAGLDEWEGFCTLALDLSPEGFVLVVVDTAGRAMQGMNENSQEHVSLLTQMVSLFQKRLNCAVLVIHHTGFGDQSRAKGSGVFAADPDTTLVLSREGKEPVVDMKMSKQKDAQEWEHVRSMKLENSGTSLVVVPAPPRQLKPISNVPPAAEAAVAHLLDNIVAKVLQENPGRIWTQKELAERLACIPEVGVPSRLIERKLKGLREDSASCSGKHYDADSRKWRWRG
jgi:hypothetical protein